MRLVTFQKCDTCRLGALVGDKVIDLNLAYAKQLSKEGDPTPYILADALLPSRYEVFPHKRGTGNGSGPKSA
ncbi:hypothetical protein MASR2M17_21070 [Aminivibrio sp.]